MGLCRERKTDSISQGVPVSSAQYVDILERPVGEASAHKTAGGVAVDLDLRGFEIRTLKLTI